MVVQNFNVTTSSQRGFLSVKSSAMLATRNLGAPGSTAQISSPQQNDSVQLSNGKVKKPNPGLALGHLKQANRNMQDNVNKAAVQRRAKPSKVPQYGRGGKSGMPQDPQELRSRMLELMFELILGKSSSMKSINMSGNGSSYSYSEYSESFSFTMSLAAGFAGVPDIEEGARAGWRVERFEYESEYVSYQAQGIVNTADGRSLNVDISMYMSRQYVSYMGIDIEAAQRNLCDPLVINYGGTAASLTGEQFSFDLDSDGTLDKLASLSEGSGFLALDKNGDGKINDGSELFGPNSGCGFSELREYDRDGNGWIDEADEVFDKLVVWHKDKDGNETSYTLKELGIGAIYLGGIATEFTFKDNSNEVLGVMRTTSFFLKEDGGGGTVSHIDLAV